MFQSDLSWVQRVTINRHKLNCRYRLFGPTCMNLATRRSLLPLEDFLGKFIMLVRKCRRVSGLAGSSQGLGVGSGAVGL